MAPLDTFHPPPSVLATWPFNYTNPPETRGWGVVVLFTLLIVAAYAAVSLRIWARFRISMNPGIDDALIVFNMVGALSSYLTTRPLLILIDTIDRSHSLSLPW
jgi:hypothetical protein